MSHFWKRTKFIIFGLQEQEACQINRKETRLVSLKFVVKGKVYIKFSTNRLRLVTYSAV